MTAVSQSFTVTYDIMSCHCKASIMIVMIITVVTVIISEVTAWSIRSRNKCTFKNSYGLRMNQSNSYYYFKGRNKRGSFAENVFVDRWKEKVMFQLNLKLLPAITPKAYLAFRWEVLPVEVHLKISWMYPSWAWSLSRGKRFWWCMLVTSQVISLSKAIPRV